MLDVNKKVTARIRTFAADLDAHRQARDNSEDVSEIKKEHTKNNKKADVPESTTPPKKEKLSETKPSPIEHFEVTKKIIPEKSKHIPAYHELQKQTSGIQKKPDRKIGNNDSSKPVHTNNGFGATVITDTKENRQNLIVELTKSLSVWFKNVTKFRKRKTPKYSVPEANHRKGVIQKATTKTGSIFTADSETLKEQIRRRQQQLEDEPETFWSPYTDTGYSLLTGPETIQNIKVEFKKQSASSLEIKKTETEKQTVIPKPLEYNGVEELISARRNLDATLAASSIEDEPKYEPEPVPVPEAKRGTEQIIDDPEVEEIEEHPVPRTIKRPQGKYYLLERFDTNTLTVILLMTIITLVVFVFVSRIFIQSINNNTSSTIFIPVVSLVEGSVTEAVTVTTDNVNDLTTVLNNSTSLERTSDLTELAFVTVTGEEIAPSYIFDLLNLNAAAAMKQSLTNVRFLVADSEKTMLLKFVDATTVRGSFLIWENSMLNDFARIFSLQTNTETSFVDDTLLGYDIRTLESNEGIVLTYCIVNENTALIAKDKSTLEGILNSQFPK